MELNEEEKKAVEVLKNKRASEQMLISGKMCVDMLINLITKQQKEIEEKNIAINKQSITISKQLQEIQELKEENKEQSLLISTYYVAQNYIPKSKIKEINENTDTYRDFTEEVLKLLY